MKLITKYNFYRDILYIYLNGYPEALDSNRRKNYTGADLLDKIKRVFTFFVKDLNYLFKKRENFKGSEISGKNLLFYKSSNNFNALCFLDLIIPNTAYLQVEFGTGSPSFSRTGERKVPLKRKVLYSYQFLPMLFIACLKRDKKMLFYFDALFQYLGLYEEVKDLLKSAEPRSIFFATDHDPVTRSVILVANELNIKTVYLQHASVSSFFPPLSFDISMLEGRDAMNKYLAIGKPKGSVFLVGMPKYENYKSNLCSRKSIGTIGIAVNQNDDLNKVKELISSLVSNTNVNVIYRFHPLDRRVFSVDLKERVFKSSADEKVFDFLSGIEMLIAGDSSIHLEAVLMNVYSVYYKMNNSTMFDYYGYVKNGLVERVNSKDDVLIKYDKYKNDKPDVLYNAALYNAAIEQNFNSVDEVKRVLASNI